VISIAAGYVVGHGVVAAHWQQILLWLHRGDFGVTDPLFHRDVGFFVFSLPLYQTIARSLLLIVLVTLACTVAAHAATGAIRTQPAPISATRGAHAHLLVLAALLLLITGFQHWLGQFALELPRDGGKLPGAGYTQVHVELPWLRALVAVSLAAAAAVLYGALRRSWMLPTIALIVVGFAELANPAVLPSVGQRVFVDPQSLSRERPYLAHSVRFTQLAYGLDRVAGRSLPANATITPAELRANRDVLRNIQLWDTDVLRPQIDQQQSIGSYYTFPSTTVDRYRQGSATRAMIIAQRELDLSRLEPSGRTWANARLAYTHGYGLVAVPAGGVGPAGQPRFSTSEFDAGHAPTRVRQPRIYFGVQPPGAQPWVIVKTKRSEIEKPLPGDSPEPEYHYTGDGGISLKSPLRRAMFALRFGELNLALSETLTGESRVILHRDVGERLRTLAPFLHWEDRPEVVVVGGRIQFLAHGYTTSDSYPYSAEVTAAGRRLNYMRGAVVAAVDAFSGDVTLYVTHESDPILRAWREAFPDLFTPESRMPAELRAHLRYPRELFDAQSAAGRDLGSRPEGRRDPLPLQAPEPSHAALLPARAPPWRRRGALHAHHRLHAPQPGEPERIPDRHDGRGRPPAAHAADAPALADGARPLPGEPADSRDARGGQQVAPAEPGDRRPRQPGRERGGAVRAARDPDRRLVPVRPADLRDRAGQRRDEGPRGHRVPQRAGRVRQHPQRGAAPGSGSEALVQSARRSVGIAHPSDARMSTARTT
jgi:uncharacterized membrane protein (UPF0182 family)